MRSEPKSTDCSARDAGGWEMHSFRSPVDCCCGRDPRRLPTNCPLRSSNIERRWTCSASSRTSRNDTLVDLTRRLPTETRAVEKVLETGRNRHAELAQDLIEHNLELRRRAHQIDEVKGYIDALVEVFEALTGSRRWRVGNLVLSLPRRLLRLAPSATAIDSAAALVNEYRLDGRSGAETLSTAVKTRPKAVAPTVTPPSISPKETTRRAPPSRRTPPAALRAGVDIVVCVHNALDHVKRCLGSVMANTTVDFRLIVVDDGSGAETSLWLRGFAARHSVVRLIETDGPLGYTCAANRGLHASTMGKVVLLNSDTIVPRLWLEALLGCMADDDRIGIVGPLSNAASWQSVPERFDGRGGWAVNDLPPGYNVDEFGELVYRASGCRFPRVAFLNGFCLLIDRKVVDRIGYLDEESFPRGYGEENDYCLRARDAGFELAIADHCHVYHAKSKSFGSASRDKLARDGREALLGKYGPEVIEQGTEALRNSTELAEVRSRILSLVDETRLTMGGVGRPGSDAGDGPNSVLYLLPVRGGSGGANSVVQEAAGMRALGVDARVAVYSKYVDSMLRFYRQLLGDSLISYDSPDDLLVKAEPFDVIVATLWSTPRLIKADGGTVARQGPRLLRSGLRALVPSRRRRESLRCDRVLHPGARHAAHGEDGLGSAAPSANGTRWKSAGYRRAWTTRSSSQDTASPTKR